MANDLMPLLEPTIEERKRFVRSAIALLERVVFVDGMDENRSSLLRAYSRELRELEARSQEQETTTTKGEIMTTSEIVSRLRVGEKITLHELHRLERRLGNLKHQAAMIAEAITGCYRVENQMRVPNPRRVNR